MWPGRSPLPIQNGGEHLDLTHIPFRGSPDKARRVISSITTSGVIALPVKGKPGRLHGSDANRVTDRTDERQSNSDYKPPWAAVSRQNAYGPLGISSIPRHREIASLEPWDLQAIEHFFLGKN